MIKPRMVLVHPTQQHLAVEMWVEGSELRYWAADGVLSPQLRAALQQLKPHLVRVLHLADQSMSRSATDSNILT